MCLFQMCVRRFIAGGDRLSDSGSWLAPGYSDVWVVARLDCSTAALQAPDWPECSSM